MTLNEPPNPPRRYRWIATAMAAIMISGIVAGAGHEIHDRIRAPDLKLESEFPAGFDSQIRDLRAVSYDGRYRCPDLKLWEPDPWKTDGIAHTVQPSTDSILAAHPIENPSYEWDSPTSSILVDTFQVPEAKVDGCTFDYNAETWELSASYQNKKGASITDSHGTPYAYSATKLTLGGNGDGHQGTRVALTGYSEGTDSLVIHYRLYTSKALHPSHLAHEGYAPILAENNSQFLAVFDIPPQGFAQGHLLTLPFYDHPRGAQAPAPNTIEFHSLHRLETSHVELHALPGNLTTQHLEFSNYSSNSPLVEAPTIQDTWASAGELVEHMEATGHALFLVQHAFEPEGPLGKHRTYQDRLHSKFLRSFFLDLEHDGGTGRAATTYSLAPAKKGSEFVVGFGASNFGKDIRQAAAATASLSYLSADGVRIVQAAANGPSPQAALTVVEQSIKASGHGLQLKAQTGGPSASKSLAAARGLLAAAATVSASSHAIQAANSDSIDDKVFHSFHASRIVAEAIFSTTWAGAAAVIGTHLAIYFLDSIIPQTWKDVANDFVRRATGSTTHERSAEALEKIAPGLENYASAQDARFLQQLYREPEAPSFSDKLLVGSFTALIFIGALAGFFSRRS